MRPPISIRESFRSARTGLQEAFGLDPQQPHAQTLDQVQAAFRRDLLSLGIDPGNDDAAAGALAGLAVGYSILLRNFNLPPPLLLGTYLGLCETFMSGFDEPPTTVPGNIVQEIERLESPESPERLDEPGPSLPKAECVFCTNECSMVLNGVLLCAGHAAMVSGMLSRAAALRPQVGGPGFNRMEEQGETDEQEEASGDRHQEGHRDVVGLGREFGGAFPDSGGAFRYLWREWVRPRLLGSGRNRNHGGPRHRRVPESRRRVGGDDS